MAAATERRIPFRREPVRVTDAPERSSAFRVADFAMGQLARFDVNALDRDALRGLVLRPSTREKACAWIDEAVSQVAVVSTARTVRARGTRCMERLLWGSYDTADHPRPKAIECRG